MSVSECVCERVSVSGKNGGCKSEEEKKRGKGNGKEIGRSTGRGLKGELESPREPCDYRVCSNSPPTREISPVSQYDSKANVS